MGKTLIIIAGPTAAGKTALGIQIAKKYDTEIISADSRQFYCEMRIGTAKPSKKELGEVKHHFIDNLSINQAYSVGHFEKEVIELLEDLFKVHEQVVMIGGSGLFINAVSDGFDELPRASEKIRNQLNQTFQDKGILHLQQKLKEVDPVYYSEVDLNNPQRLIRALEVVESSGKPFSYFRTKNSKKRNFNIIKIGVSPNREKLYSLINQRVDQMIENGLIEEVRALYEHRHLNALNTVGYQELFDYLDGKHELDRAIEKIKQNTRRFAKRQLTWFKKSEDMKWFDPMESTAIFTYLDDLLFGRELADRKS